MIHIIIGENTAEKHEHISALRLTWNPSPDALKFDYEILYGQSLSAKDLKKSLIALPAIADKRFILIHDCEKLTDGCKQVLLDVTNDQFSHGILVLDCVTWPTKDEVWSTLKSRAKVLELAKPAKENVFDMTRRILAGKPTEALQILNGMFDDGVHPLQIMGGIVWAWGRERGRLSQMRFEKGLRDLQEADLNIKRSRLNPQEAIELLVVKLAAK